MAAGPAPRRCGLDPADFPSRKRRKKEVPLASRVDTLALEFAEIKAFLLNLQPISAQATEVPTELSLCLNECFSRLPSTTESIQDEDVTQVSDNLFSSEEEEAGATS
ncbi:unnamed protein product [Merluccius merluccius]